MIELALLVLIGIQMIPAKWILYGLEKNSSHNKVRLLALGLLGLEAAAMMFIGGVVSLKDAAELMEGVPLMVLCAGGPAGLLAIIIVRICKDWNAACCLPHQERCIYWIDVLLKVGLMLLPSVVGARAFLSMDNNQAQYSTFSGIVMICVQAEIVLLILRLVLPRIWEKRETKDLLSDEKIDRLVRKRFSKPFLEKLTPEQYETVKANVRIAEEGRVGRKYGVWAENPYEPLPEAEAETPKEDAEEE
ncbi:MAG: hypothetical protein E7318_08165 [Clostridiales bacterium]|nr:hypothetical protein [Clostridiales bacterium]